MVYKYMKYSCHVGANAISGFRNIDHSDITDSHTLRSKARMWIRRELSIFPFLLPGATACDHFDVNFPPPRVNNYDFLVEFVVGIVRYLDIKGSSGTAEDLVVELLGLDRAKLFLHELNHWMRSPYTHLADWDREVQYLDMPSPSDNIHDTDRYGSPPPEDMR